MSILAIILIIIFVAIAVDEDRERREKFEERIRNELDAEDDDLSDEAILAEMSCRENNGQKS